jgi:hypothetical protein
MAVVKKRSRRTISGAKAPSGDAIFGEGVVLDASAWLVAEG